MADKKSPFGLSKETIAKTDWDLAIKRILHDIKSDFIYAPHLRFIYKYGHAALIAAVKADLTAGKFTPAFPVNIEVPKSARMQTKFMSRSGPPYSRQGSILQPKDRLLYQAIADAALPHIAADTDEERSFSHRIAPASSETPFLPTRECWNLFRETQRKHAADEEHKYVLKTDISNCFGAINQHILVNNLKASGLANDLADRLEVLLTAYTGDRSSRGILQGLQPSDLFGNFYLNAVDTFLSDANVKSARYVDDIYVFLENANAGEIITRDMIQFLRSYDLSLQESKSLLMPTAHLPSEEPDLVDLFAKAVEEISEQLEGDTFEIDYGFQTTWDDEDPEDDETSDDEDGPPTQLELAATISLFESVDIYPDQQENIERFCLPLFTKGASDYAVPKVMENFQKFPSMSQIYCTYLVKFIDQEAVAQFLAQRLSDKSLLDWQIMWVVAALHALKTADDAIVKSANDILKDANRHEALRAAAAMFVGRFGDHVRRKALMISYATVGSPYIQAAIYFSSMRFPAADKTNAKNMWADQSELNKLITAAMANLGTKA